MYGLQTDIHRLAEWNHIITRVLQRVSIPDETFARATRLAAERGISRSQLVTEVARREPAGEVPPVLMKGVDAGPHRVLQL